MAHSFPLEEGGSELAFSLPINAEGQGGDAPNALCGAGFRSFANWKHRIPTLSAPPTWRGVAVIFTLCRPIEYFIWLRSTASQVDVFSNQAAKSAGCFRNPTSRFVSLISARKRAVETVPRLRLSRERSGTKERHANRLHGFRTQLHAISCFVLRAHANRQRPPARCDYKTI